MDDLTRIEQWLERLEQHAQAWLLSANPEEMPPDKAAASALKGIALIARLMELRKQFDPQNGAGDNDEVRQIIAALLDRREREEATGTGTGVEEGRFEETL